MATGRPSAIVDELLSTVDYLRISLDDTGDEWLRCSALLAGPGALAAVVAPTKPSRGTDRDDVATSLFVQGWAFRIATVAIGSWLLADAVLDVAPDRVAIAIGRGRPNAVNLLDADVVESDDVAVLHRVLIDDHLSTLVEVAHASCRVGETLLWGNVAAACASSFGAFAMALPDRRLAIRSRAEEFFASARREVGDAGRLVPVGTHFAWERRSCCLWYKTESAWLCEDCSLRPAADRAARYAAVLAADHDTGSPA
jgi:iron complex transport system ATP-binding protein